MSDALIAALQNPELYDHPVTDFKVIQTHISWVILTGQYAYKIKKPMDFGFLDFSTLEKRKHFCAEETRLNRRLAEALYLGVIPITGDESNPVLDGDGEAFEYAIKMAEFPQDQLLSELLKRNELSTDHIDNIAEQVARFHQGAAIADEDSELGTPDGVMGPVTQNFEQILPFLNEQDDLKQLEQLQAWAEDSYVRLNSLLQKRKTNGCIRECHGDLHLGNMTQFDGDIVLFDCIEFNDSFRWIDGISEVAFFCMDLERSGQHQFANHFVNTYLESTGDYEALQLFNFYKAYRAMVRAKVTLFRLYQDDLSEAEKNSIMDEYRAYADLAEGYMAIPQSYVLMMHGYSGTGKTTISTPLVDQLGVIRLRSDVERKRLFGEQNSNINEGIYTPEASDQTFNQMAQQTNLILSAGYPALLDATFLYQKYRDLFHQLAETQGVALEIISCELDDGLCKQQIEARAEAGNDASDATVAVYEKQKTSADVLTEYELNHTLTINTADSGAIEGLLERFRVAFAG